MQVVVPSIATAQAFVAAGGKESLIKVLYNGVAPLKNDNDNMRNKQEIRSALGLPNGFIYGVFSRLAKWKGQHIAIEALKFLPDATCLIVGDAQFGEKDYVQFLHQQAEKFDVADRVIFLGHRDDVPTLMQAIDVYCHPSIAPEPFGLTIVEAMRASLPIAATRTGAIPEILECGVTGIFAEPNDVVSMAEALKKLLLEPQVASDMGNAAKRVVMSKFTIEKMQADARILIDNVKLQKHRL